MPFRNFKTCLIDKDLKALIISGDVPHETLAEKWDEIQENFSLRISGNDIKDTIKKINNVESLNSKIHRITLTLTLFIQEPIDILIEVFKNEGWDYDTTDLYNYVQCIRNEIASMQIRLEESKKKIDTPQGEPTHEDYAKIMNAIRDMVKWYVPDTICLLEFCNYYIDLVKYSESLKRGS